MSLFFRFLTSRQMVMAAILLGLAIRGVGAEKPDHIMKWEGLERAYKLYIPENMPDNAPLLLVLHDSKPGLFNVAADRHKFVVCYPRKEEDARGKTHWNVGYPVQKDMKVDDVEYLTQLVYHLQKEYGLSQRNVFCTGKSNGGEMCYLLAAKRPEVFAAVAPISGLMLDWLYRADYSKIAVPVLEIHGTHDSVSDYDGDPENKGGWGAYLSVPMAINFCAVKNRCNTVTRDTVIGRAPENRTIIQHRYSGGIDNTEVWLYEVVGGGHTWGWEDMDTGEELWKFFSKFIKPEPTEG